MSSPEIKTTVVGSYPVPQWLRVYPSEANLRDATLVALKTQELAGLDVISDGELVRFDINHPAINGMIEYFIRRIGGIDQARSRTDIRNFQEHGGIMNLRGYPEGVVRSKLTEGTLNLKSDWEKVKHLTQTPLKFTLTSPYMISRTLLDYHYKDLRELNFALAEVLRDQIADIDAPVIQVDEAFTPGHPQDLEWVHEPINVVLDAIKGEKGFHLCFGNYDGQKLWTVLWQEVSAIVE